jgi:hypothetical protein
MAIADRALRSHDLVERLPGGRSRVREPRYQ